MFQLICGTEIRNIRFNGKFFLVAYDAAVRDVSKERNCLHSQGVQSPDKNLPSELQTHEHDANTSLPNYRTQIPSELESYLNRTASSTPHLQKPQNSQTYQQPNIDTILIILQRDATQRSQLGHVGGRQLHKKKNMTSVGGCSYSFVYS